MAKNFSYIKIELDEDIKVSDDTSNIKIEVDEDIKLSDDTSSSIIEDYVKPSAKESRRAAREEGLRLDAMEKRLTMSQINSTLEGIKLDLRLALNRNEISCFVNNCCGVLILFIVVAHVWRHW